MFSFRHGSHRKTKCYYITIFGAFTAYISYDTVIALSTDGFMGRVENSWGRTTGRHMNEMGVNNWPIVDVEVLEKKMREALLRCGQNLAMSKLKGKQP